MIDRKKRDELIKNLRSLLSGTITNLEYEKYDYGKSCDDVIRDVFIATWELYDSESRQVVHKIVVSKEGRDELARYILFLYSNLEYEYKYPGCLRAILYTISPWMRKSEYKGDDDVWPFFRTEDFEKAKQQNIFFFKDCLSDNLAPISPAPQAGEMTEKK